MISDILLLIIAFIALLFASIIDIKIKEIPNWITYSLLISALSIRLITSIATEDWLYTIYAVIAVAAVFLLGTIFYHTQQWGGGDSKLIIALSAVFATTPYFLKVKYPFILILILCIFALGAVYNLVYAVCLAIKNWKKFLEKFNQLNKERAVRIIKIIAFALGFLFIILIFLTANPQIRIMLAGATILLFFCVHIWIAAKSVELACLYAKIPMETLTEGDWLKEDIKINSKLICRAKKSGITQEDIKNLKKHKICEVTIKRGIPFAPSFLAGLVFAVIISL